MTVSTINPTISPMKEDYIRGSDMIDIMNGNWNKLWNIKKGLKGRPDLSHQFNVQLGLATEEFNIKWAEENYLLSFNQQAKRTLSYGSIPLSGTLDGFSAVNSENEMEFIGIECKHTYSYNTMDKMLDFYMPQLQFYIWLGKLNKMIFSVIFGNQWKAVEVYPSAEYLELMKDQIKMFWDLDHEGNAKQFEMAKKMLKEEIKSNEREVYNDLVSVKKDSRGSVRITKKG